MKLSTSLNSAKKYPNQLLIWANQIAELRNKKDTDLVEWSIPGNQLMFFKRQKVLEALDKRLGKFFPYGKSYFIGIDYVNLIPAPPKAQSTLSPGRIQSTTAGVQYEIGTENNKYVIKRFGKTKTTILSKSFDTHDQAFKYLTTACNGKV